MELLQAVSSTSVTCPFVGKDSVGYIRMGLLFYSQAYSI
jgi:hypothetical protein